jgi:NitT/TauT family transport system permease protein
MSSKRGQAVLTAIGLLLFLALWELVGRFRLAGATLPPVSLVLSFLADPARRPLFERALTATVSSAGYGYLIGGFVGIGFALLGRALPVLKPGADRTAAAISAIPPIALGPVFVIIASRETTPMALSALMVFFAFYVAASSGLAQATPTHRNMMTALGASRFAKLIHLDLPASLPSLVGGMKYGIPTALIGAILGEWFGASRGLGVLIVSAMQNFQIPLLWSAVLLVSLTSLAAYGVVSLLERVVEERFGA